jgi:YQGE family putative transporter
LVSGLISSKISFRNILIGGVWLMFYTIFQLFSINPENINSLKIILIGIFSGMGSGVYWAARNYLSLQLTDEKNRDFFSGIDYILSSAGRIITPLIIGIYIGLGIKYHWFSATFAYRSVLIVALALAILVTLFTLRIPKVHYRDNFSLFLRANGSWTNVRKMFFYLGFFQSSFFMFPTILIMKFIGGENMVGTLNAVCYLLTIFIVYYISSRSTEQHRTRIMKLGFFMLTGSAIVFTLFLPLIPAIGTYILIFAMFFTDSIMNFPARATMLKATDEHKMLINSDGYQHMVDVEFFSDLGRVAGLIIFYFIYLILPYYISLPLYMIFVASIQWKTVEMSKRLNG